MRIDSGQLLHLEGHSQFTSSGIREIFANLGSRYSDHRALGGVDQEWMTYAALGEFIREKSEYLLDSGLGREQVVLACLPDGPEALTAWLTLASVTTVVPVARDEPEASLKNLIERLPIKAVFCDASRLSVFESFAAEYGLLKLSVDTDASNVAGKWEFVDAIAPSGSQAEATTLDDAAILGRTAGSTAESKIVAWSQNSILASAQTAGDWMELTQDDRSLCMMPFAHMHSVVRSTLPCLLAGGSVVCAPGVDRLNLLDWLREFAPTYMTGVPSIFRILLELAEVRDEPVEHTLRFVASGSDRIDRATVSSLNEKFGIQVREFYGMSEVSPMLTGSVAGELAQADGSVGMPLDPWSLSILNDSGEELPEGSVGLISVRGGMFNTVLSANAADLFEVKADGWRVTGDLGYLSESGRLVLAGRQDGRINRAGKKIAPEAVEAALCSHPDVTDALVFPIEDVTLGCRVAALVIPRTKESATVNELRGHVARQHPDYMVPERIWFVENFPVNSIGKVSRNHASKVYSALDEAIVEPTEAVEASGEIERGLMELFCEILGTDSVDVSASFSDLGGDSFQSMMILTDIENRFGTLLTPAQFIENSSIRELAHLLAKGEDLPEDDRFVRNIQKGDNQCPLFIAHSVTGYTDYAYTIAQSLQSNQTIYLLQWQSPESGEQHASLEAYAELFLEPIIRRLEGRKPFALLGHSFGAQFAYELGQQLEARGFAANSILIIDDEADLDKRQFGILRGTELKHRVYRQCKHLLHCYTPKCYSGRLVVVQAEQFEGNQLPDTYCGWNDLAPGRCKRFVVIGDHLSMLESDNLDRWVPLIEPEIRTKFSALRAGSEVSDPESVRDAYYFARLAAKQGNLDEEIVWYAKALDCDYNHPYWVYFNYAEALWQNGDQTAALDAYRNSLKQQNVSTYGYAKFMDRLIALNQMTAASEALEMAIRETPESNCAAKVTLAGMYVKLKRDEDAIRELNEVIALDSEHGRAMLNLSEIFERIEKPDEALNILKRLIQRPGTSTRVFLRCADLMRKTGDVEGASKVLENTIGKLSHIAREEPNILYNQMLLSIAFERSGDRSEAARVFDQAVGNLSRFQDLPEVLRLAVGYLRLRRLATDGAVRLMRGGLIGLSQFGFFRKVLRAVFFRVLSV